jgi:hypothetical protein
MRGVVAIALLLLLWAPVRAPADDPPTDEVVRYENGLLTVRANDVAVDRLLGQIAAQTGATMRGIPPTRTASFDFRDVPLAEGLKRILGEDSFMLAYGTDGQVRTIRFLGRGEAVTMPSPAPSPDAAVGAGEAPLAEEEKQAGVLQKPVVVTDHPPLRRALGTTTPAIGQVLHATTQQTLPNVRAGARETVLKTFASDPEVEAAYLSTLEPVDDATLAQMLKTSSAPGAAEEWMSALSTRAPSPALRLKAAAVLKALRSSP